MYIRAVKLSVKAIEGDFGFKVMFSRNLTIIRGKNSSGKSTLLNSLLYGLGMEEIIGGKGEKMLPYATKEYFEYEGKKVDISSSEVFLELEDKNGEVITLRRTIKDPVKSSKLVEVAKGGVLSEGQEFIVIQSLYLHDPGSAKIDEGFYKYMEKFMGYDLPNVPATSGGETKLYLQTIFAAIAVEQKRGWSDYIAGIPFYGIREARLRVVEYLLNFNIFESNTLKNKLDEESIEIASGWNTLLRNILKLSNDAGTIVFGLPQKAVVQFDKNTVSLDKLVNNEKVSLAKYIESLRQEYATLEEKVLNFNKATSEEVRHDFEVAMQEVQKLSTLYESIASRQALNNSSIKDYQELLAEAKEDIVKNKAALKLKELGATYSLLTAVDSCPTCQQSIKDSLLTEITLGPQMDLVSNINYLERQSSMLERQINGLRKEVVADDAAKMEISKRITIKKEYLDAIRLDFSSGASQSRATVKRQLQIEDEVKEIESLESTLIQHLKELHKYSEKLSENQEKRRLLPKLNYSENDLQKISIFEKFFRGNAASFGYESAPIEEIELNKDTLTPFLASIELREVNSGRESSRTDIKSDSSASDFVRLIWSYLIGIYQTSSFDFVKGNHPGILIFDEPGQHSMAASSQHALLNQLSSEKGLQSIVAASFDENEDVFKEATDGIIYELVQWDSKAIQKINT